MQEWRRALNDGQTIPDVWWFAALIVWSISIFRRWEGDTQTRDVWIASHLIVSFTPIFLSFRNPENYRRNRIHLLITVRLMRTFAVLLLITPHQNSIWKIRPSPTPYSSSSSTTPPLFSCFLSLFTSEYMKLAYLVCQSVAHIVPFEHHIWLLAINTVVAVASMTRRCQTHCVSAVSLYSQCSVRWADIMSKLEQFWIFSAHLKTDDYFSPSSSPWEACFRFQSFLLLAMGFGLPLLMYSAYEEFWKRQFMYVRTNVPLLYDFKLLLVVNIVLSVLLLVMTQSLLSSALFFYYTLKL